jgi:hypothetical protein
VRVLGVGLWLVGAAAGALAQLAPAPDPVGADTTYLDVAEVRVHGAGPATLSAAQVFDLQVELSRVASGWVAARRDLPRERVAIGALARLPLRVYGSALESIEDALAREHARAGHAGVIVELRPGAVIHESGDGRQRRNLIVDLRAAGAAPAGAPAPAAIDRFGSNAVLVTVRALALDGLEALPVREEELLRTAVDLSFDAHSIPPGWTAARPGVATRRLELWELGRFQSGGVQLYGSAIQTILEAIGQELYGRGIYDVTVDLAPGAIRRLASPGSDGLLLLRVSRD